MEGFWVVALIIGFIVGAGFSAFFLERTFQKEAVKEAVIDYCTDTNQLGCSDNCKALDYPNCVVVGQTIDIS